MGVKKDLIACQENKKNKMFGPKLRGARIIYEDDQISDDPCATEHFIITWPNLNGVREARTLDLRSQDHSRSYETYTPANCATTPLC